MGENEAWYYYKYTTKKSLEYQQVATTTTKNISPVWKLQTLYKPFDLMYYHPIYHTMYLMGQNHYWYWGKLKYTLPRD